MTDAKALIIGDPHVPWSIAKEVAIDLDKLIITKLLIQANSGGGKSYAIRWLLEQTYGKVQHIVIDREGEFSTLRTLHPYLLVGRDGDVAADIGTAKLLARKVLELSLSTVVDLSEMSPGQQRAYVQVFVDSLNHAPRSLWKDCIIVIDEAHIFAPEKGKGSSEATESIALLLSTGRKRGFCPVLATQRLAKLNKDVAAECLNKLIGRTSNEDIKRAGEELAQGKESSIQLRGLEPGRFWAYGPAIAPEPVLVRTGKVKTQPPARGAERSTPPAAPEEIRAALAKELAELPKQAADEAQSITALTERVRALTRELDVMKRGQPEPVKETIRVLVPDVELGAAERERGIRHIRKLADMAGKISNIAAEMMDYADFQTKDSTWAETKWLPERVEQNSGNKLAVPRGGQLMQETTRIDWVDGRTDEHTRVVQRPTRDVELQPRAKLNGELPRGALKMLDVLSRYPDAGLTAAQLGTLSGYAAAGGTFGEYLRQLRRAGYVDGSGGTYISLTSIGVQKAGGWKTKQTSDEIFRHWCNVLPAGPRKMLEYLRTQHPRSVTLERLGDETGYSSTGGTFGEYLRQLKRVELVQSQGGMARLVDELAP